VIGVGGGSALDAAKAIVLKVGYPKLRMTEVPLADLPARIVPLCAIPTTAGTGSEVGRSAVITSAELGRKVVVGGPPLLPQLAILDPELTVSLPPQLTAATGMDALTHAIEAFVCPVFHPMCDGIALEAIYRVKRYLPRAVARGEDIEARGQMLVAASMGAVAFQKDLGAAHSLAHPLSTEFGLNHGLANAVVLPSVVRFNGQEDSQQYARVAQVLELSGEGDPAERVASFIEELNREIGISQRLRDLDVPEEKLDDLADKAIQDGCHLTNPRRCTKDDMLRMYRESW
jgi:alcohol dehydrogenase class IV